MMSTVESPAHYRFSPSAASRWLACPGSLTLPEVEDEGSEYAREGTAAHDLAEQCWLTGLDPSAFIDGEIEGFPVTEEMAEAVQLYMDTVEMESRHESCEVWTENKIAHSSMSGFGGTVDCMIWNPSSEVLTIVDFKYGAGVVVEVEKNPQLLCYALLALNTIATQTEGERQSIEVRLIVVQPRCHHEEGPVRSWTPSQEELEDFWTDSRDCDLSAGHQSDILRRGSLSLVSPQSRLSRASSTDSGHREGRIL